MHAVADVAGVPSEVLIPAEAEIDVAGFRVCFLVDDQKEAGRNLVDGVGRVMREREAEIGVFERAGVEGRGDEM